MAGATSEGSSGLCCCLAPTLPTRDGTNTKIQPLLAALSTPGPRHQSQFFKDTCKAVAQKRPGFGVCNGSGAMSGRKALSRAVNNSWRQNKPRCLKDRHPAWCIAQLRRTKKACLCFTMSREPQKRRASVHILPEPGFLPSSTTPLPLNSRSDKQTWRPTQTPHQRMPPPRQRSSQQPRRRIPLYPE